MLRRIGMLVFILTLVLARPVMAQTASPTPAPTTTGKISGSLVNKTAGTTSSVANQDLTLGVYQGSTEVNTKTGSTDSAGKFSFEGLSTDSTYTYQMTLVYESGNYFSDPLQFAAGESEKTVEIDVFDTTTSGSAVSVMMAHAIVHYANNALSVKEYYLVSNTGDRTYVGQPLAANGGNVTTLDFTLPSGAGNFQTVYGLGSYNLTAGNQVYSSEPVTPAGSEISYTYTLPCNSDSFAYALKVNYQVSRFDFLTSDAGMKISGPGITQEQPLNISNINFQDYSVSNIAAGTVITAQLSNLTSSAAAASSGTKFNYTYLLVLLILPAAFLAVLLVRRNRPSPQAVSPAKDLLMAEIARLDDDFADGKIDATVYKRLREEKKRQLVGGG